MSVLAFELRHYRPDRIGSSLKCGPQGFYGLRQNGRTIDQGDERGITATIQDLMHSELQRTELSEFGMRIGDQKSAGRIHDGHDRGFIIAGNNDDEVGMRAQHVNGCA